jgi:DNA repair exonuclease SbcCD ATPase subunit
VQREVDDRSAQIGALETSLHVLKQMMETLKERNGRLERDKTAEAVEAERLLRQLRERIADAGLEQWAQAATLAASVPGLQSELERALKQQAADRERVQELEQWIGTNINVLYPRLAHQVNAALERGDSAFRLPVFWTEIDFAAL